MQVSKAVHWRAREAAEWAARHGAVETFALGAGEMEDGPTPRDPTTRAQMLERLADSAWKVVGVSWHSSELNSDARIYMVQMLPVALMQSHVAEDIARYAFELRGCRDMSLALKLVRSSKMSFTKARGVQASQRT
jgi:hypothetical protein